MARRGRISNLRRSARKAQNTVARKGGKSCGRSPRGSKRKVCVSFDPIKGMKCKLNHVNNLYACMERG